MKTLSRILAWLLLSLILQGGICLFLDKFYFIDEKNVKITQIRDTNKRQDISAKLNFPIASSGIELSYDGGYTSYFDIDKNFKLAETRTGNIIDIPFNSNAKCISFKWLPDSNIIILVEVLRLKKGDEIRFSSFNVTKGVKKDIGDSTDNDCSISLKGQNTNVAIEVSTLTGVMYIKVTNDSSSKLYRIDRNESMTKISTHGNRIGSFQIASHDDFLVYEDKTTNEIKTTEDKKILEFEEATKLYLIAADGINNIYIGNKSDGKTSKIYYGNLSDDVDLWNYVTLENPTEPENIIVTYSGQIYLNTQTGNIINLKDNSTNTFQGELIGIYDKLIASNDSGILVFKYIK